MARIKNEKQIDYEFTCEIEIRVGDLNYGGHVGSTEMIGIAHDARVKFLKSMGFTEKDLGDGKTCLVIADMGANFLAEVFYDDKLVVKSHIGEIEENGFRIFQCMEKNNKTVALVETGIVTIDYEKRKITTLPQVFLDALKG